MRVHSAVFPLAGPWGCDVWDTLPLRALWDWRFFSGPARHQARRGRSLLERARTRWVAESRRRARSRCGTRNAPLSAIGPAPASLPVHLGSAHLLGGRGVSGGVS